MTRAGGGAPRATVRLQFHAGYTLDDGLAQVPYLAALGISHVYASPLLTARAGSTHGYDGVDPTRISAELGGEEALRRFVAALHERDMGLILDIVPNHMAVGSENAWWIDVLTWGLRSRYAHWFDIDWEPLDPAMHGRLLLPVLGKPYGEALADGELGLVLDAQTGRIWVRYFEHRFPVSPDDYARLLRTGGEDASALEAHAQAFEAAVALEGKAARDAFDEACAAFARALRDFALRERCEAMLARWSDVSGTEPLSGPQAGRTGPPASVPGSAALEPVAEPPLHALLERQAWRIAWWRTASDEINWRRFFDVHELVGMNVERTEVFDGVHATVLRLVEEGLIDGLRIDHVDGLTDPGAYCRRLREQVDIRWPHDPARRPFYLVVEKILARDEPLRGDWSVDGSTGYEFMNQVNEWLHDPSGEVPLASAWAQISGRSADFEAEALGARRELLSRSFDAQLNATVAALREVAAGTLATRDITAAAIQRTLVELLVHFPAYRTYALAEGFDEIDRRHMERAVAGARATCRADDAPVLDLLVGWLGGEPPHRCEDAPARRKAIRRFQQLSAPLAAKAIEDTAFYRYGRLLSRNDVGFDPAVFASDTVRFHAVCAERREGFPLGMLTTATHDHKRGEDVRARLAALSERPDDWRAAVERWRAMNDGLRTRPQAPSAGEEAMLYQTLVGAWPLGLAPSDASGLQSFAERVWRWQEKALREAKLTTDWIAPNAEHEGACRDFLMALLDARRSAAFLADLCAWVDGVAAAGAVNGLVQTLLKYTVPGVPDLYQGTEWWDLSLVDPDNRRPVDWPQRAASLEASRDEPLAALAGRWRDGRVKQALIARLLACRARAPELFARGEYRPLSIDGVHAGRLVAFERRHGSRRLLVVAASRPWGLGVDRNLSVARSTWGDGLVLAHDRQGDGWRDVLAVGAPAGQPQAAAALPPPAELLSPLPFAVWANF
jgi:(1->4)-alpha-D-glucan 1-alpha-D-glucosylmutase